MNLVSFTYSQVCYVLPKDNGFLTESLSHQHHTSVSVFFTSLQTPKVRTVLYGAGLSKHLSSNYVTVRLTGTLATEGEDFVIFARRTRRCSVNAPTSINVLVTRRMKFGTEEWTW